MPAPEAADRIKMSTSAIASLLASDMGEELLAIMREIFERNPFAKRLAYSPDEAAVLLGISRELVHDLLRVSVELPGAVCADGEDVVGRDGGADRVFLSPWVAGDRAPGAVHDGAQVELLKAA